MQKDSMTASDPSDRGGKSARPADDGSPADPADRVREALEQAAGVVTSAKPDVIADGIKRDLDTFLEKLIPGSTQTIPKGICDKPDPQIAAYCHQLKLSNQQAKLTYEGTRDSASAALRSALGTWSMAVSEYEFNMANADWTLRQAVTAATRAYDDRNNPDSRSRSLFLYFTMKQAIASAIQTYEGSAASAGATLAGAAGSLLGSYQAYVDSINGSQSQRLYDEAVADQTFWQAVEAVRDTV